MVAYLYQRTLQVPDGILGVGPVDLSNNLVNASNIPVPTVLNNAFSQNLIPANVLGVSIVSVV